MKILFFVPFEIDALKGNSVAARRLSDGFRKKGHHTAIIDPPTIHDPAAVQKVTIDFQPDVVIVLHAWRCAKAIQTVRERRPFPIVVSMRGTDLNEMLDDPTTRDDLVRVLDLASGITVFHESGRKRLTSHQHSWENKTRVIPNGIELPESAIDFRKRLGVPPSAFVFVVVAGLREVKRPLFAIPILAELRCRFPQIIWMHAGPVQEKESGEEMKRFINLYRHENWLFHEETVPHNEIDSFLRAGNVFVASSRSEGMPHSVREAMLVGIPLMLSDIEGHRNMAAPETEALFFQNETDFRQQARRLIENVELRTSLVHNARARVEKELLHCEEISSYLDFLQSVVTG